MSQVKLLSSGEAAWAEKPNSYDLCLGAFAPTPHTSASVIVLSPEGLLLIAVLKRGWDLPGGHIEAGETALQAALREVQEEAGLALTESEPHPFGWAHLELHTPKPDRYRYPYPHTYQPVFLSVVEADRLDGLQTEVPDEVGAVHVLPFSSVESTLAHHGLLPLILHSIEQYLTVRTTL